MTPIRVLIVDDSRLMRNLLTSIMQKDREIQVVGGADNGIEALDKIRELKPDVVALDMNMPMMDGLSVLREAKEKSLPTCFLVISSLAKENAQITLDAISLGAIDFITKPPQSLNIEQLAQEITSKIHVAFEVRHRPEAPNLPSALHDVPPIAAPQTPAPAPAQSMTAPAPPPPQPAVAAPTRPPGRPIPGAVKLTVIGGSSGSIQTLRKIIPYLRSDLASAVALVLPLPPFFLTQFALELAKNSATPVYEVTDNMPLELGKVYLCPGGRNNIILADDGGGKIEFRLIENTTDKIYTPSIDVFMESAAMLYRETCRGLLVSGTGSDGVAGLTSIRARGGKTYVEDATSAVAKQLPTSALAAGCVDEALDIAGMLRVLK
ncbi:MAG: chemotaxis protein CheB [Candidatus Wallbacteria bacterium]|nr:chemotaxis protein CheB [Candidatus Wallbacteria bacterium]